MKIQLFIIVILISGSLYAQDADINHGLFQLSDNGSSLRVESSYKRLTSSPSVEVPVINRVHLECLKKENICRENIKKTIRPSDDPTHSLESELLLDMDQDFEIVSWLDGFQILAVAKPRAADINLIIYLADKSIIRISKETEARGALGRSESPDVWLLD